MKSKKFKAIFIPLIIILIFAGLIYYFGLPVLNIHSTGLWGIIIFLLFLLFIMWFVGSMQNTGNKKYGNGSDIISVLMNGGKSLITPKIFIIPVVLLVLFIVLSISSATIFNASTYANRITLLDGDIEKDIPTEADINKISLMDSSSAAKLGDRKVGSLSELVSQFNVSDNYYTFCYKGQVYKIAPLEYASFFKYMNNKSKGIPGYVLVDPLTNEAEYIKVEGGINYSESAFFSKNLLREFRFSNPSAIYGDITFQLDEDGTPYWIASVMECNTFFGAKTIKGVVLMNATTGETTYSDLNDAPEWVDLVFSGYYVSDLFDSYGTLSGGWWNYQFAQKDCRITTDDFGYIVKGDDVYIYTGVTSTVSDESNLGFIMANSRTGEFKYYPIAGAEEYSAMSSAQGLVQNYGYKASFPSLVNVGGEPTYVMVLKDSSGLVKLYAMVNVENYTIVSTGETLKTTLKEYQKNLANAGTKINLDSSVDNTKEKTFIIKKIQFVLSDGETYVYITSDSGEVFKQAFSDNESLVLLNEGDTATVSYIADDEEIINIITIIKK